MVKEYFYIQQTRFGDRIRFVTDIEEDCLDIEIPGLTLQPLIENAFIHGVEEYEENGIIRLDIIRKGEEIHVEVSDNGPGMDPKAKRRLLAYAEGLEETVPKEPPSGHSTGIGVRNVMKRLQLFYQKRNVVEIESGPGKGTTFRLVIPAMAKGGEKLAQSTGR
ncbi:two-component sensor histidine kinase [Bacillus sp. NRRL B-14911]|uniref:sensor histidine kinase n=1 Tax=Bacillus sp. NRRL B-14911 TaxID=313627 RepID=UPI00006B149C|nr:two-component sensor histidine kinase [Bacillus sp. NRRL B-14911]